MDTLAFLRIVGRIVEFAGAGSVTGKSDFFAHFRLAKGEPSACEICFHREAENKFDEDELNQEWSRSFSDPDPSLGESNLPVRILYWCCDTVCSEVLSEIRQSQQRDIEEAEDEDDYEDDEDFEDDSEYQPYEPTADELQQRENEAQEEARERTAERVEEFESIQRSIEEVKNEVSHLINESHANSTPKSWKDWDVILKYRDIKRS